MIPKILLAIAGLVVAFILIFRMNVAKPVGGIDEGRLFLAGATSLMQGKGYPITQRTPLYSLFLASIGYVAGVDPNQTIEGAHVWPAHESYLILELKISNELTVTNHREPATKK